MIKDLNKYIEHTCLRPDADKAAILKLCCEAESNGFLGVCVNPFYVPLAKSRLKGSGVKTVTVIGFPLGANQTFIKAHEASLASDAGADEADTVIALSALKNRDYEYVKNDIKSVVEAAKVPVKVIIETGLLTKEEITAAAEISAEAGAAFVKTCTGFAGTATEEAVRVIADALKGTGVGIKASGGIKDRLFAEKLIEAGAVRLGTSSGIEIMRTKG